MSGYILKVKDNEEWHSIPAIRGTSVYLTGAPSPFEGDAQTPGGWSWTIVDERYGQATEVKVYNGAAGTQITVDDVTSTDSGFVDLQAVSYKQAQALSITQQGQARENINSMENISAANTNNLLQAQGGKWVSVPLYSILGINQSGAIPYTTSTTEYRWESLSAISSETINNLFT